MDSKICTCGRVIAPTDIEANRRQTCFTCHVSGISFGFRGGGGYGRENFHERTNAEFMRENDIAGTEPRS